MSLQCFVFLLQRILSVLHMVCKVVWWKPQIIYWAEPKINPWTFFTTDAVRGAVWRKHQVPQWPSWDVQERPNSSSFETVRIRARRPECMAPWGELLRLVLLLVAVGRTKSDFSLYSPLLLLCLLRLIIHLQNILLILENIAQVSRTKAVILSRSSMLKIQHLKY